jgi:hypothetical protein
LLSAHDLQTDESLLTGDSVSVRKLAFAAPVPDAPPGGDDLPYVYSGTLVVRGRGLAEVTATGARSQIGKIGIAITRIDPEPPRLRAQTQRLVRNFAVISLSVCVVIVPLYGVLRGAWFDALLNGIALGMSMLPEEFPLSSPCSWSWARGASRAAVSLRAGSPQSNFGSGNRPVHGQDRHLDREPHDDRRVADGRRTLALRIFVRAVTRFSRDPPIRHPGEREGGLRSHGEGISRSREGAAGFR